MQKTSQIINGKKSCSHCKVFKDVLNANGEKTYENFGRKSAKDDGWQSWCKPCKKGSHKYVPVPKDAHKRAQAVAKSTTPTVDVASAPVAPVVVVPVVNEKPPIATNTAPVSQFCFIEIDGRMINLQDISVIDSVPGDGIEIVMRSTEMSNQGFVHSRVYRYSGIQREKVMAAIVIASGQEPQRLLDKIEALESAVSILKGVSNRLEIERDAAMALAAELETKHNKLKAMFD